MTEFVRLWAVYPSAAYAEAVRAKQPNPAEWWHAPWPAGGEAMYLDRTPDATVPVNRDTDRSLREHRERHMAASPPGAPVHGVSTADPGRRALSPMDRHE
jgi:hypothetical protein